MSRKETARYKDVFRFERHQFNRLAGLVSAGEVKNPLDPGIREEFLTHVASQADSPFVWALNGTELSATEHELACLIAGDDPDAPKEGALRDHFETVLELLGSAS